MNQPIDKDAMIAEMREALVKVEWLARNEYSDEAYCSACFGTKPHHQPMCLYLRMESGQVGHGFLNPEKARNLMLALADCLNALLDRYGIDPTVVDTASKIMESVQEWTRKGRE